MVPRSKGSIINTASFVAVLGSATSQISYTASKGGVLAMTRELGVQFARQGIRVNALCPGPVNTPLLQELFAKDPERAPRRLVHVPIGRFAEPEELAAAVAFLASDDASFITASTFLVDGGISTAYVTPLVDGDRRWPTMTDAAGIRQHRRQSRRLLRPVRSGNALEDTVARLMQTIRLGVVRAGRVAAAGARARRAARRQPRHRARGDPALADAGYLVSRRGRYGGTFVSDALPAPQRSTESAFSRAELDDVLRLREILEVGAARMAARPDA